jgi:hypothetical protein
MPHSDDGSAHPGDWPNENVYTGDHEIEDAREGMHDMPVCIAGMARSGTSLCTRTLNLCGLSLGDEADLLPPGPDNPDGFWENSRFVAINEALLSMFGGAWDCPPVIPLEDDSEPFARLVAKAETTLELFAGQEPWGWKDPRNSLTLPFWRRYFPEMKVVICLRNPLEVAQSLYRRSWYSTELSLTLWYTYNQRLLSAIPPEQRIVTHYDAYFADPEAEIRRVLDFLAMPAEDGQIAQACAALSPGSRHHRFTTQQMIDVQITPAVLDLYLALCDEAGGIAPDLRRTTNDRLAERGTPFPASGMASGARDRGRRDGQLGLAVTGVGRLDRAAMDVLVLRDEVRALNAVIDDAGQEQERLRARTAALERQLAMLKDEYERRGAYVEALERQREADTAVDTELRSYVQELEQSLNAAHVDHRELHRYAQQLEGSLGGQAGELEQCRAYIRTLEEQCGAAQADRQRSEEYTRTLEADLATARRDHEQLSAYTMALEHQYTAAQANHQEVAEYARSLERQVASLAEDREHSADYTRQLEGDLAAAYADHTDLDAWAKTLIERIESLEAANGDAATRITDLERQLIPTQDEPHRPTALSRMPLP